MFKVPKANRLAQKLTVRLLLGSLLAGSVACAPNAEVSNAEVPDAEVFTDNSSADSSVGMATSPDAVPNLDSDVADTAAELGSTSSPDVDCDSPQTQLAMNMCSSRDYQAADTELNRVYQDLKLQLSDAGSEALADAEMAWLSFRDRDCAFSKSFYEGGSIAPLIYNGCMEAQTLTRIAELRQPQAGNLSYAEADADLNQTYQLLMDETRAARKDGLVGAQLAWIDYRDRHCTFEARYQPDSIDENQCLARITETRIQQLEDAVEQASL